MNWRAWKDGRENTSPVSTVGEGKMMRYLRIETKYADGYICPWRNAECLGALCMAWTPDDDREGLGRGGLVHGEEG